MGGKKIRELLAGERRFYIDDPREWWYFHTRVQALGFHTRTVEKEYIVRETRVLNSPSRISVHRTRYVVDAPQQLAPVITRKYSYYYKNLEEAVIEASHDPLPGCRCRTCCPILLANQL